MVETRKRYRVEVRKAGRSYHVVINTRTGARWWRTETGESIFHADVVDARALGTLRKMEVERG